MGKLHFINGTAKVIENTEIASFFQSLLHKKSAGQSCQIAVFTIFK